MTSRFRRWGFGGRREYAQSMRGVYSDIVNRALSPVTPLEEYEKPVMPRRLTWVHVSALGVGLILGAGIFVSTGKAAADIAG